jgi:Sulfatase
MLLVFVVAKVAVLNGRTIDPSVWTPIAYIWQDVFVASLFGLVDRLMSRSRLSAWLRWALYWMVVAYAAVNIPVGRVLSTPLTWPMLRAARGPLADSILLYATWTNALLVLVTLGASLLPFVIRTFPTRLLKPSAVAAVSIVALGPIASARVDAVGLDRNVLEALVSSGLPRVASRSGSAAWRISRFDPEVPDEDLSSLRGIARGRNVVLVSLESTAAQYLSLYGASDDVTPHLNQLARQAVVFEHAYAAYPESIKGLFSVLCSMFPAFDRSPEMYGRVHCRSAADVLGQLGYRTGLFHSGRFAYLGMESIVRNRGYDTLEDAGDIGGDHESSFGVDEPATVVRMLAWIDAIPRGQPFFLTYLPISGHHPYETPERGPFADRDEKGRYLNALHYGDRHLGALIDGLRLRGLAENTLWIVLGDHGEAFGQHEGNYGHTFFLYDENVRVPFVVAVPGQIAEQRRVRKIVSLVDAAPTIFDLLGIPRPGEYQGQSMLESGARMALFFTDYSLGLVGLRDGPWKFIYELESSRSRLFNTGRDSTERVDVSAGHAVRAEWYRHTLQGWIASQKGYLERLESARR